MIARKTLGDHLPKFWYRHLLSSSLPAGLLNTLSLPRAKRPLSPAFASPRLQYTTSSLHLLNPDRMPAVGEENREIPTSVGNFDRVIEPFKLESAPIKLAKWKSRKTGLTVVWADVDGPLVNGYFTVVTEIFNDSGVPHTLEHLVFLGSEKYPYKGILDSLANRAFANGTNAWTDTSHTAYTVTTAGSDGFLRILPIYLDHILYATLSAEGFITEVYHINGKGEDAGVVYSEMQGRQNSAADLMNLRTQRELYPPTSAYRSETGGEMEALRVLTIEQIRQYHEVYYRPHNLQLIIAGKVDPTALLNTLQSKVEPSLIKHGQDHIPQGWKRPFLETASKGGAILKESKSVQVEFPEHDESIGDIQVSWVGPSTNDFLLQDALDLLGTYLTHSAISPLAKQFIEIDDPFCTDITFHSTDAEKTITTAYLSSVPVEHLVELPNKFKAALAHEAEHIDLQRMRMVIERGARKVSNQMEDDAHEELSSSVISNFIYGSDEQLVARLSTDLQRFKTLASWSAEQWSLVFKEWLVERPSLTVIGKPSAKLADQLAAETNSRVEETKLKYGPDGLKKLQEKLENAQKVNDVPFPRKFLSDFPVPNVDSIKWIQVETARASGSFQSGLQIELDQKDKTVLPYFVQFDHVDTSFITFSIHLSPTSLPPELFKYLNIYLASFFSLPVVRSDGSLLTYDEVVRQLDKETVAYSVRIGSSISQSMEIYLKAEKSKYAYMIGWLKDLLWGSKFDIDRLRITATKALQSIPALKRDGDNVSAALFDEILYSPESALALSWNLLKQDTWLPQILEELKARPQDVVNQMERIRAYLLKPSTMRVSVIANLRELDNPKRSWSDQFQKLPPSVLETPLYSNAVLSEQGKTPSGRAIVTSMPSIESSYAYHIARGPQGYNHPDRPALTVAISVLNAMEGYLWKSIRGTGLAYGASIRASPESGHVYLVIYRSPDSWKAFSEAEKVMKDLISKKLEFDELILESAKSSLAYSTAARESTISDAAFASFTNLALKGVEKDASRQLLEKTKDITLDQVLSSIQKYILPIFESRSSIAVVASSVTKAESISSGLTSAGFVVERKELNAGPDENTEMESLSGTEGGASSMADVV